MVSIFQEISLESTIRLSWYDERIKPKNTSISKDNSLGYIIMNRDPVQDFWFPDIYIDKAKAVRKPTYQVPPAYLRIYPSGRLLYSARVNYDISCPMHFQYYPVGIPKSKKCYLWCICLVFNFSSYGNKKKFHTMI